MPNETQETVATVNSEVETREQCEFCNEYIDAGREWHRQERVGAYCESCYEDSQVACRRCGGSTDDDNLTNGYCSDCEDYDDDRYGVPERRYSTEKLPKFMSKEQGEIITSPRIFSAELECYYPDGEAMHKASIELPREYGIEEDGSLNSRGVEFQTPMLQGKKGEDSIKDACAILNRYDFDTNRSAGLHVHLDGKGLMPKTRTKHEPRALAQAFMFYVCFEDVLMSLLPASRRSNRYCLNLRGDYHATEIRSARNLEALEKVWYRVKKREDLKEAKEGKYHHTRYFGLNLHSLLKDGHVEIRFHSATLNAAKILEWTNLHQTILDMCVGVRVREENRGFTYKVLSRSNPLLLSAREKEILQNIESRPAFTYRMHAGTIGTDAMNSMHLNGLAERTERMFELLKLPERARAYFLERQKAFISTREDKNEQVCVE
jgi:hypothetical protein